MQTPYEEEVKRLRASVQALGLPARIEGVANLGSWEKNCQYKANFILQTLKEQSNNVVWLDADAELQAIPVLFESLTTELAYHYLPHRNELLSGTLFLRNCSKVHQLVNAWVALNAQNAEWDQKNLQQLVEAHPNLTTSILPAAYCYIYNHPKQVVNDPVIVHYQASRRWKRKIRMDYVTQQAKKI